MSKIIVTQGVPASGKTSWATEFIKNKKDWAIVSRDAIRESTGTYWVPEREDYISILEEHAIRAAIASELNVIIDATNLNPDTVDKWENLALETGSKISYKQFPISVDEALKRDKERMEQGKRGVGKKVILNFFRKYYPEELKNYYTDPRIQIYKDEKEEQRKLDMYKYRPCAVIVDLDGTLCLHNGRGAFEYSKIHTDILNQPLTELLACLYDTSNCPEYEVMGDYILPIQLIFVSGREGTETAKKQTIAWLAQYFGNDLQLFMRKEGDFRSDEIVKQEIYENNIKPDYKVLAVFDDRDKVVKMWRKLGLLCLQVNEGDF